MSTLAATRAIAAAAIVAFLAGCSATSSIGPKPAVLDSSAQVLVGFHTCPATGTIEYVSDAHNNVIYIFAGKFSGQAPCGQLVKHLFRPFGLFVQSGTHDLYVANHGGSNVTVFHRGQQDPYNVYKDPTRQNTTGVVVAKDGTVITANEAQKGPENGSLSTWLGGPGGGQFIGNFPFVSRIYAGTGSSLAVAKSGKVYFDQFYCTQNCGELWYVSCPAGACGTQSQVAGVSFNGPGGMAVDASGDVLLTDAGAPIAYTFELPNPNPSSFPLVGTPYAMAINKLDNHWFVTDTKNVNAAEYEYPSGTLIGSVACPGNCIPLGVAVDP